MRFVVSIRRLIFALLIAPVILVAAGAAYWGVATGLGFYVHKTGWEVAEILVRDGKPATDCKKIEWLYTLFGPPEYEQERSCFYDYAKLSKDPTVCEYLMPSEYGIYCIAEVLHESVKESFCTLERKGDTELICVLYETTDDGEVRFSGNRYLPIPSLEGCRGLRDPLARNWCWQERAQKEQNQSLCANLPPSPGGKDECLHYVAFVKKDLDLCNTIRSDVVRKACSVRVRTVMQYPELFMEP